MRNAFVALLILAAVLFAVAYRRGDDTHKKAVQTGRDMFVNVLPILAAAFTVAGLLQTVLPGEALSRWLGEEAGWRGIVIAPFIGALVQGGPFSFFPLFDAVFRDAVGTGTAIAMITGWAMHNVGHLPFEFAFLGPRFVVLKLGAVILVPPLSGTIAHFLFG